MADETRIRSDIRSRQSWRFIWSHERFLHRLAVRGYNRLVRPLPFALKYRVGVKGRAGKYPYRLVQAGDLVVQIGAPQDTLLAGRSRAIYFSLLAGAAGQVVVVEPDQRSVASYRRLAELHGLTNMTFMRTAAWSRSQMLTVYIDDSHPATNFSEGTKAYTARRLRAYRRVEIPAASLDTLLSPQAWPRVRLVSVTTNGAENQILQGMSGLMDAGLPYICLAKTGEDYVERMAAYGYRLLAHDDRGFTFRRSQ